MGIKKVYEEHYKKLLIIPFVLLLLAFVQIGVQYTTTGDFVNKGISLKGGSTITLTYDPAINPLELEQTLREQFPRGQITLRTLSSAGQTIAYAIDSDAQQQEEIAAMTEMIEGSTDISANQYSVEVIGSSLGESFFRQIITALLIAFVLMGIVVMLYFRTIAPSLAVILAAFSDIIITLAIFNLTGMKLNSAGIAAFLMLIGYSVDSDILLSTRVLRRTDSSLMGRIYGAMKTGLTMTTTTLAAILIALVFVQSDVVKQIMLILFIGLLVDIVMTYIQNVGILRLYLEKKRK